MKIISGILILITAALSLKHGWDGLHFDAHPEQAVMASRLGLGRSAVTAMSVMAILVGITTLLPGTYFIACMTNAMTIVLVMALSLRAGIYSIALMEIPFLVMPLVIIYLGHPLKR